MQEPLRSATEEDAMDWYDLVMLAILIGAVVTGARRGLAWQAAPIGSLLLGYVVGFPLSDQIAPWFGPNEPTNRLIALLVLYLGISFGVHVVARFFRESIEQFKLESYDRHLGALFGGIKGAILCLVITFFAVSLSSDAREHVLRTRSGKAAGYVIHQIEPILPKGVDDLIRPYLDDFQNNSPRLVDDPTLPLPGGRKPNPFVESPTDRPAQEPTPRRWSSRLDRLRQPRANAAYPDREGVPEKTRPSAFLEEMARMVDQLETDPSRR
jgi:membrane protein required for colicin V production